MPDVRVPQKEGAIAITNNLGEKTTWHVSDHIVQVAEENLPLFLERAPAGSHEVAGSPSTNKEKR